MIEGLSSGTLIKFRDYEAKTENSITWKQTIAKGKSHKVFVLNCRESFARK